MNFVSTPAPEIIFSFSIGDVSMNEQQNSFALMVVAILKAENSHEQQVAIEALAAKCWWPGKPES